MMQFNGGIGKDRHGCIKCGAVCCSVVQCVAVCCSELQGVEGIGKNHQGCVH